MHHAHAPIALVLGLLVTGGCLASKSSLDDGGEALAAGSSGTGIGPGSTGTTTDGPGVSSAGGPASGGAATSDDATPETDDGVWWRLDVGDVAAGCEEIDLDGCYSAVFDACGIGKGTVDEACVSAVVDCFPMGTPQIAPRDITSLCIAELSDACNSGALPGCGQMYCACTVGSYPFDWTNCWHLTTMACVFGVESDCEAVVQSCYPDTTVAEFESCYTQVTQSDLPYDCNCPMCGFHEECEAELAVCLGA